MKYPEFKALVDRMRAAQKFYYKLDPRDRDKKLSALIASKELEKQVDNAVIDDPQNLVSESPIA